MVKKISLAALALLGLVSAAPTEDFFGSLPNASGDMPSPSYSGYLDVSDGKSLHYILVESQSNPETDPLILWFNGGPGCSSLLGFIQEHGPWVLEDEATKFDDIHANPYPWNLNANVAYIESPAGVGYSYAASDADRTHSDLSQSIDAFIAFEKLMGKFPEFVTQNNKIFISGESYGGIYVPYLTWQIYQNNLQAEFISSKTKYNLGGFMVGNGATDWDLDVSPSFPDVVRNFQLIPPQMLKDYNDKGCIYYFNDLRPHAGGDECDDLWEKMNDLVSDLNWYDLYRKNIVTPPSENKTKLLASSPERIGKTVVDGTERTYKKGYTMGEYTRFIKNHPLTMSQDVNGDVVSDYLNQQTVRDALHIRSDIDSYEECSEFVGENYHYQQEGSLWIYKVLKQNGIRMLHYSGDTDGAVPLQGTRKWAASLGWTINKDARHWFTDGQVSGFIEQYDGLDLVSVRGVGHMAPQWARKPVTEMITKWINEQDI